jgi:hypothetical protein
VQGIGLTTRALVVVLSLPLLWSCQAGMPDRSPAPTSSNSSESIPATPPAVAALGLSCDKCLAHHPQDCARVGDSKIIATVTGARIVNSRGSCLPEDPDPHFPGTCLYWRVYRFDQIDYSRNVAAAAADDTFEAAIVYDKVYTTDLEQLPSRGPALLPDKRYVIFAGTNRQDIGLGADWYIDVACELSANH